MSVNDPVLATEWDKTCRMLKEAAKQKKEKKGKQPAEKKLSGFRVGMGGDRI